MYSRKYPNRTFVCLMVRAFQRYGQCMQPISTRCGRGLEQILDYESGLRRYLLKMDFICHEDVLDGSYWLRLYMYSVSQKIPPQVLYFPKRLIIPNFTHLLHAFIYAGLQIFI